MQGADRLHCGRLPLIKMEVEMNIARFFKLYPDNESCKNFFRETREATGLKCRRCGGERHFWIHSISKWQCVKCKYRTGLKCGTVMENSNLNYRIWLWALFLTSLTKKGFSSLEMQRLLGHKRYEPVWLLMHKIRISMGTRDERYRLDGYIEMDEGFFEGHRKKSQDLPVGKEPKELDRQVKVIVGVSTKKVKKDKRKEYKPGTKPLYLKMDVVDTLTNKDVNWSTTNMVSPQSTVHTDGRWCYGVLKKIVSHHEVDVIKDKRLVSKVFPWVHTAISNAKKQISGLHHHVKDEYMQNYLSEFCYKFNRRYFGQRLFDRLLVATLANPWYGRLHNSG